MIYIKTDEMVPFLNDVIARYPFDEETTDKLLQISIFLFTVIESFKKQGLIIDG